MTGTSGNTPKMGNKTGALATKNEKSHQLKKYLESSSTTTERLSCSAEVQIGAQQHQEEKMSTQLADWQKQWEAASK
ncbi:uncharacterized protein PG986_005769 [Apiospora aurea]|uniref:No apical meristem-associated C-terminal domain-containing protein n=1 Tax=Apiospora aurea TaxID=335848 RepID=A0ABR1QJB7_9PEZI